MNKKRSASVSKGIGNSGGTTSRTANNINLLPITSGAVLTSRCAIANRYNPRGGVRLSPIYPENVTETLGLNLSDRASALAPTVSSRGLTNTVSGGGQGTMNITRGAAQAKGKNKQYSTAISPRHPSYSFRLIWLQSRANIINVDYQDRIAQLRRVIDTIDVFISVDQCFEFCSTKTTEILHVIVSNEFAESLTAAIHEMFQIHSIFILCESAPKRMNWIKRWEKVEGIFTSIASICEPLEQVISEYHRDFPTIGSSTIDPIELDPWLMCVQLIKEILFQTELDPRARKDFFEFYRRSQYAKNSAIDEFEQNYSIHTPIDWLACESTLSRMIHQAFSSQDVNAIMKMRFFIRGLHQQMEEDYKQPLETLTLYRGQRLSDAQLGQLHTMQSDLFFFNNFLATSTDHKIALLNAKHAQNDSDVQGVIFKIKSLR